MKSFFSKLMILVAVFMLASFQVVQAKDIVKVPSAWMSENETFPAWLAHEKGWDKEEGIDLELNYFNSGMDIVNALPSGSWVVAGNGALPAVFGGQKYDAYVVAIGNDESFTNGVLIRKDSPIAKVKGWNKDYPNVLGSPETVKGKTFLCTTVSSAHMALSSWLKVLGLTDKDVVIKNMDQPQCYSAFEKGIGDGVSLWAPLLYDGMEKGWQLAADIHMTGLTLPIVIEADKKYADAHPDVIAAFLRAYMRAMHVLKNEPAEKIEPIYRKFFLEWAGQKFSPEVALQDIKYHPVFNYEEQLQLLDNSKGSSKAQEWQKFLAKFFTDLGRLSSAEYEKVKDANYVTDKFMKMVKQPIPDYKGYDK